MSMWKTWKRSFDACEHLAAQAAEAALTSPFVLLPTGAAMSQAAALKGKAERAVAFGWSRLGLPTRRDQERTLHELHRLQSRVLDLQEQLADMSVKKP